MSAKMASHISASSISRKRSNSLPQNPTRSTPRTASSSTNPPTAQASAQIPNSPRRTSAISTNLSSLPVPSSITIPLHAKASSSSSNPSSATTNPPNTSSSACTPAPATTRK